MGDDDWVNVARVEDSVVAELLLRLKGVNTTAPPPTASISKQALLFEWRVRQRRSRAVTVQPKNQVSRDSPSTPLSFSGGGGATSVSGGGGEIGCGPGGGGGASGSGGGGGFDCGPDEESTALSVPESVPKSSDMSRSKVARSNESNSIRRSKKKKTLAELKSEDELLARERRQLQEELESVRDKLEKERVRNDNFKRIKLQQMASFNPAPITSQPIVSGDAILLRHSSSATGCSEAKKEESVSTFVLPDLNLPLEDSNSLC